MKDNREFVYVTYIRTTPERLWEAITRADFTEKYWYGLRVSAGSKAGEPFEIQAPDGNVWTHGEVLAADRPHRLSYSFQNAHREGMRQEEPSRVTFLLEPVGDVVRLTVTHDQFEQGSELFEGIRYGWPAILSGLKTFLETDASLGIGLTNAPGKEEQKHNVEGRARVFVSYIRANPELIWDALTNGETTKKYFFGRRVESDLKVGSAFNYWFDEGHGLDVAGKILECDPPRRLVVTWSVVWVEEMRDLPPARVTYQIEPLGDYSRLTVIEEVPEAVPEKFLEGGKQGWPMILSSLKSLLETGKALPAPQMG
jgi:uncharacterized protein YndB with AHSA1/START domain